MPNQVGYVMYVRKKLQKFNGVFIANFVNLIYVYNVILIIINFDY